MMRITYWYKKHKAIPLAKAVKDALDRAGVESYFYEGQLLEDTAVAIAVGGDGTVFTLARMLDYARLPILALNGGTVGFLTQDYTDLDRVVQRLLDGDYGLADRRLLEVSCEEDKWYALGDVTLSRGEAASTVTVDIEVDGEHAFHYRGDGIIVATPLGSTGYSLSSGGAVLSPTVEALAVTPISAHSLCVRPLVVGVDALVTLRVTQPRDGVWLALDGYNVKEGPDLTVNVTGADKWLRLVTFDNKYYSKLTDKLAIW